MEKHTASPTPSTIPQRFIKQLLNASSLTPAVSRSVSPKIVVGKLPTETWAATFAELYTDPVKKLEIMKPFKPLDHPTSNSTKDLYRAYFIPKIKKSLQWDWRQKNRRLQGLHEEKFEEAEPGWESFEKAFTEEEVVAYLTRKLESQLKPVA
ncbi:unnamed protein product [Orchesella dallaii]|uniref:Uncharacterized protein n=1 Tax=Orchesella dallaii TaxID=48710 RepID=A0ABP1RWZ5_9HEXA